MKSYTNIEQSKKLAKILPLESADMRYGYIAPYEYSDRMYNGGYDEIPYPKDFLIKNPNYSADEYDAELPCWSLAALLEYLKQKYYVRLDHDGVSWSITCIEHDTDKKYTSSMFDVPVDACWGMLLRLNKKE